MKKHSVVSRRDFIKILALSGVAGIATLSQWDQSLTESVVCETRLLMGTIIHIKVVSRDVKTASVAINTCLNHMASLESLFSRFRSDSQLTQLNQTGALPKAHPKLIALIEKSHQLSQYTNGAFDITVKPLLDLYQTSHNLPNEKQIHQTLSLVDYRNLELHGDTLGFTKPDMSITLDGIAKGFIVDEGVAVLQRFGFENVMVEAGGDLLALGQKAPNHPWKIGLQAPRKELGSLMFTITVHNKAVATSGDYLQAFTSDYRAHHIIDPRSGYSSPELASVSVLAPTLALADGLATAVMVMGKAGMHLVEQCEMCEAYAITKNCSILKTSGFQEEG